MPLDELDDTELTDDRVTQTLVIVDEDYLDAVDDDEVVIPQLDVVDDADTDELEVIDTDDEVDDEIVVVATLETD